MKLVADEEKGHNTRHNVVRTVLETATAAPRVKTWNLNSVRPERSSSELAVSFGGSLMSARIA
jgi:hypothetical protein